MLSLCRTRDEQSGQGRAASWRRQLAFDVEVLGNFDGDVLGGEVVEEEDLEDR